MSFYPGFSVPANARLFFDALLVVLGWGALAVWVFRNLSRRCAGGWTDEEARWWRKGLLLGLAFGLFFVGTCIPLTDLAIDRLGLAERLRPSLTDPRVGHVPTFLAMTSALWALLVLGITQIRRSSDDPALNCRTRICIGMGMGLGTGITEAALAHLFGGRESGQLPLHALGVAVDTVGCGVAAMFVPPLPEKYPLKLLLGPFWNVLLVALACLIPYGVFGVPGGLVALITSAVVLYRCLQDVDLP
jgi:hypothetical protein